jgi:hypothetical protein
MQFTKSVFWLAALTSTALATGCATITGGTTQSVSVKTQKDSVDVAGAQCVLTNSKGTYKVTTPGEVKVHRAKDELSIHCTKDGETDAAATIKPLFRVGAMVGNMVMVGVGTAILEPIDMSTGAAYSYPHDIKVAFGKPAEPNASPEAAKTAPAQSAQAPVQPAQAPAQSAQTPAQSTQTPAQSTKTPTQPTEAPAQSTQAPMQPTQAPVASTAATDTAAPLAK